MDVQAVRVSDAERRVVVDQLGHHYAEGRLTLEELRERTVEAWFARTDADLAIVLRELPAATSHRPGPASRTRSIPVPGVGAHTVVAAAGVAGAWVVEARGPTPGDQWPLAMGVAWAGVLALHAAGAWLRRQAAVRTPL